MFALARLVVIGFIVLTVIYVGVSIYSRLARRRKLIHAWDDEGQPGDREDYISEGLEDYDSSLRRKLILGIYVVPVCLVALIIYLTNFY